MVYNKIACGFVFMVFFNLTHGESVQVDENNYLHGKSITPVARYYSLTTCSYNAEPGYMCIGCKRALHCYPSNLAILVDCNGVLRPYCYDGRCSIRQGSKCVTDGTKSTLAPTATNVTLELTTSTSKEIIKLIETNEEDSKLPEANEIVFKLSEVNEEASKLLKANEVASKLPEANKVASKLTEDNDKVTNSKLTETNEVQSPSHTALGTRFYRSIT